MDKLNELLAIDAQLDDLYNQLNGLTYGSMEIRKKDKKKYLYVHKRVKGNSETKYVGEYSQELYDEIEENNATAKAIKKEIKKLAKPTAKKTTNKDRKLYLESVAQKFNEFNNNGKPTIAFFCDVFFPLVDGVVNVLDNYAKRLNNDYNVIVFVPEHNETTVKKDYMVYGIKSMYLKFVNYDLAFPELDTDFKKVIKSLRIDIIHCHSPFFVGMYASKLAKKLKVPFVCTFHSQYKQDFYKSTKNKTLTAMLLSQIMKVFNSATEVWTMHQKSLETLISYGYKGKSFLIPNATDFECPENITDYISTINSTYQLENIQNVFLFVGRLVATKNILFIVDVMAELKSKGINFKMVFVGDGPDEGKLKSKIKKLKLENEVILTGRIMDKNLLGAFYHRADLFVFPSFYDTDGIVRIESACYSTPVILAENSVASVTTTNNVNGYIAKAEIIPFSNRIIEIISNKPALEEVGKRANQELYVKWQDVIEKAKERYTTLINANKAKLEKAQSKKKNKNF